jgi:hypothetical protein
MTAAPVDIASLIKEFETIQGMMSRLAAAAFVALLIHQNEREISGDLVEFGVYKGRSAFLLSAFRRRDETLHLVDTRVLPETRSLFGNKDGVAIHEMDSRVFFAEIPKGKGIGEACRMVHIDGSHTLDNVWGDLEAAEGLLNAGGLAVLDDFQNPNFPQVQAAFFKYIYTRKSRLRPFLIGANKCFVCPDDTHRSYIKYAESQFSQKIEEIGFPVQVSKTDRDRDFDVVTFRGRKPDEDKVYGAHLYGHFFK